VLGDTWFYSIVDFSWSERTTDDESNKNLEIIEPTARHSHCIVSDNDGTNLYMLGGMSENDAALCNDAFWIFDTNTDKWTNVDEFNYFSRRIGHVAIKHKESLIIFGGYGANSSYSLDIFAIVIDLETKIIKPITQVILYMLKYI
jgi:N-acetylneuraminic acid mutarotase